ncbi:MAG: phosphatidylserine decarboxylase [Magnetococcales bacterium]|nr:phosphatidylserine decarboxylase [Magnetococcales bacterium]
MAWILGIGVLLLMLVLLRFGQVSDYLYAQWVKDPPRTPPVGRVIVAPADGTVLYVKPFENGLLPEIVKRGVPVPVHEHLKRIEPLSQVHGYLIGIYMSTHGVHLNRVPLSGEVEQITVFNGPHMSMTRAEVRIILGQLIPGWVSLKKWLGLAPFDIENQADYILKSARESLTIADVRGARVHVTRIADYSVGKILTWVQEGEAVTTGQKLGMITWGSQTDLLIEGSPGLEIRVSPGDRVLGGESVLATY